MPFGLKNAGATYSRVVYKIFTELVGKIVEIYVGDMLVKRKNSDSHIAHLESVFTILREFRMKLNPGKFTFGVQSGKFWGYMVSQRRIKANPDKIRAIEEMVPPRIIKEVQKLKGSLAALSRFISRAAERCLPFFRILKKMNDFKWND